MTGSTASSPPEIVYASPAAHLADELSLVGDLARRAIGRIRAARGGEQTERSGGIYVLDREIDALLDDGCLPYHDDLEEALGAAEREIDQRCPDELPSATLRTRCGLDRRTWTCFLLCLAPQLDHRFRRIYGYLLDDLSRPWCSLAVLQLLLERSPGNDADLRVMIGPTGALRRCGLLEGPGSELPLLDPLLVPADVEHRVVTGQDPDPGPGAGWELLPPEPDPVVPPGLSSLARHLQPGTGAAVALACSDPARATRAVNAIASSSRRPLLRVDAAAIVDPAAHALRSRVARQARLTGALLLVHDPQGRHSAALSGWFRQLQDSGLQLAVASPEPRAIPQPSHPPVRLRDPDLDDRFRHWQQALARLPCPIEADAAPRLAGLLPLEAEGIAHAVRQAWTQHAATAGSQDPLPLAALVSAARDQLPNPTTRLAQLIRTGYDWSDLVLPPRVEARLKGLSDHLTERYRVFGAWGFGRRMAYGSGTAALFAGESGTGKTMAASVIANHLGLDCLKVDLSTVVSKYIGETEKHLDELFGQAEASGSMLLFDEADAIFGRRTEVKTSNDRYANLETGYLLQRLERFTGLAILTTNLRSNMDEAFTRRLRVVVDFPSPDESQRLQLWQQAIPQAAPLDPDCDLAYLATHIKLTGGNIVNAALEAAVRAAAKHRPIGMRELTTAIQDELLKSGKAWFRSDFGPYQELLDDAHER